MTSAILHTIFILATGLYVFMAHSNPIETDNPIVHTAENSQSESRNETGHGPFSPNQMLQLRSSFTDAMYIGVIPEENDLIQVPGNQPHSCPAASGSWFPGQELNLRSTCPWIWEVLDNGVDTYPRFLKQAKCLCTNCIGSTSKTCHELRYDVPVLRRLYSENGVAILHSEKITVTINCFCAAQSIDQEDAPFVF
ncbi:interleukin-17-4 [Elysia marginata]|uniref:Interleukin-17-4 n=1 Tax=Elysia marginata TaxID=1093978 RepID=A0AAV4EPC4_9GAST|nr:interleukin-17-4 [Elysia marginata]